MLNKKGKHISMIRTASVDELGGIIRFMKKFEDTTDHVKVDIDYAIESYGRLMKRGVLTVFVMEEGDEITGSLSFLKSPSMNDGILTAVELWWFMDPEHRGNGLQLFDAFEKSARDQGCKRFAMIHMVDSFPDKLESLYKRRGYGLIEKHYVKEL